MLKITSPLPCFPIPHPSRIIKRAFFAILLLLYSVSVIIIAFSDAKLLQYAEMNPLGMLNNGKFNDFVKKKWQSGEMWGFFCNFVAEYIYK